MSKVDDTIFFITKDDANAIATRLLGRRLSRHELKSVTERLEEGLKQWEEILRTAVLSTVS
ncbi:MAG: hypothetical protein H7A25_05510 [Leptospiraceae bacterium]|nr:hypothetical protein [Leptospiraceae bacterium]MCP5499338.1 hypothetical protein [Leptospiraceae bacterium]